MRVAGKLAAAAAAAMLLTQPAVAADAFRDTSAQERRTGAFAGVNVRVPLGTRAAAKPSARLQMTMTHEYRSASAGLRSHRPAGIEIGADGLGTPELYFGGAKLSDTERRLGLSGTADWLLPAALLTAVVVGVVLLTDKDNSLPEQ